MEELMKEPKVVLPVVGIIIGILALTAMAIKGAMDIRDFKRRLDEEDEQ